MTISMSPYLNFAGNTREAMEFYHSIFGGKLDVVTFAHFGITDMPADGVMHAALQFNDLAIYATDAMPGAEATWNGSRNYIAFMGDDAATLTQWFDKLAEDGKVGAPLQQQVWGDMYGQLTDKFGIEWMFNVATTPSQSGADSAEPDATGE